MTSTSRLTTFIASKLHTAPVDPTLALIFPGQGSQQVGMAQDLCQTSTAAREAFEEADSILGPDLSRVCFQGPEEELRLTANAQLAIMVTSLACLAAALEGGALRRRPAFLAGHSLGEYTALVAAGTLTFQEALRLVARRGRLMQEAAAAQPGVMAALLGLSEETAEEVCRLSGAETCNYNAPTQIVVGGAPDVVARASGLARQRGARVLPLNVSGAFHTSLMTGAAAEFARAADEVPIADPVIPVISNVAGRPLASAGEVRAELKEQLTSPVRWHQSMTAMTGQGVQTFVEVGPGRVLSALLRRIAPAATALSIDGTSALPSLTNV